MSGQAGPLLVATEIVTVTWKDDTENLASPLQAFGAEIAQGAWWSSVGRGYCTPANQCMGKGGAALFKQVGDFPMMPITDSATSQTGSFRKFIDDKMKARRLADFPTRRYALCFLPTSGLPGDRRRRSTTCAATTGAASVTLPSAAMVNVPYVVIPRCQVPGSADLDVAISNASREIIEAATNPYRAQGAAGFFLSDPAWAPGGGEVGDFCADPTGSGQDMMGRRRLFGAAYLVQRERGREP